MLPTHNNLELDCESKLNLGAVANLAAPQDWYATRPPLSAVQFDVSKPVLVLLVPIHGFILLSDSLITWNHLILSVSAFTEIGYSVLLLAYV